LVKREIIWEELGIIGLGLARAVNLAQTEEAAREKKLNSEAIISIPLFFRLKKSHLKSAANKRRVIGPSKKAPLLNTE
jgi:hypothetical protein